MISLSPKIEAMPEALTEALPTIRVSPQMKNKLGEIAKASVSRRVTDHIRWAIELYIQQHERALDESGLFVTEETNRFARHRKSIN